MAIDRRGGHREYGMIALVVGSGICVARRQQLPALVRAVDAGPHRRRAAQRGPAWTATLRILMKGRATTPCSSPPCCVRWSIWKVSRRTRSSAVTSIADHVRRMHEAMHDGDPAFYAIPDDPRVIGEYLFLYGSSAGPDGLSAFVDHANRNGVIRALSKTDSATFSRSLLQHLQEYASQRFANLPVRSALPAARSVSDGDERHRGAREDREHESRSA
jgi:hypothetical protein